jgi:hypothetical protein
MNETLARLLIAAVAVSMTLVLAVRARVRGAESRDETRRQSKIVRSAYARGENMASITSASENG